MTVKQFVMLLTAHSIIVSSKNGNRMPYKYFTPIPHIVTKDGYTLSVQAHGGVHAIFKDVPTGSCLKYPKTFGKELLACETNCVELNQYGIDKIEDIEAFVNSHGGIDIEATMEPIINKAVAIAQKSID